MTPEEMKLIQERFKTALSAPVPHYYCNGFANSLTPTDVVIAAEQNGTPVFTLNISYTTAKSLSVKLGALIAALEAASERPILTNEEITKLIPTMTEEVSKK